jgi:tetratricopeptide (TPR) repeat protein
MTSGGQLKDELIQSLADNLSHLDEYDPSQIMPQIRDRLNQWVQQQKPTVAWQRDPLIATLPEEYRKLPVFKQLEVVEYSPQDMGALQEAIWLRDISRTARGSQLDDASVAEQLFDWTIRNIQLVADGADKIDGSASSDAPSKLEDTAKPEGADKTESADQAKVAEPAKPRPQSATQILLLGRGTARQRAWIFLLLLRQQGLEGVMLGIPGDSSQVREWLPALVADKDLYLFDPQLGMPIPGPAGKPATLAEVATDDGLLRKLDLSSTRPYPVRSEELKDLVAYVEASPAYLARRMKLIEAKLSGQNKAVLSASPEQVARHLDRRPLIKDVRCWTMPYELIAFQMQMKPEDREAIGRELVVFQEVPALVRGRALQFKGALDGEKGAKAFYLKAHRSNESLARAHMHPVQRGVWETAKQDASYWLGTIALEQQNYPVAVDYFSRRTLELHPDGPWTDGAHYNLARTYEASGQPERAIDIYQSDSSPQKHGNRLRARRLKAQLAETSGSDKETADKPAKSADE